MTSTKRKQLVLYIHAGVFGLSFAAAFLGLTTFPGLTGRWAAKDHQYYRPSYELNSGMELALIYVGSSSCAYSNADSLPGLIKNAKLALQRRAQDLGRSFTTTGISKDWVVENGVDHLAKFGDFDEIMTGRSWLNEGVVKYIWQDMPGRPATPQVLVVDQVVTIPDNDNGQIHVDDRVVIARKIGLLEISDWLNNDFPLPTLRPTLQPE